MKAIQCALAVAALLSAANSAQAADTILRNGSFEKPKTADGTFNTYSTGDTFNGWTVVGAAGNVATVSGTFTQNGFSFPAKRGKTFLDLTGVSNTATGVQQTIATMPGASYTLTLYIGVVYDPDGIFGTTSTVNVLVDGAPVASLVDTAKAGTTTQKWTKYTVDFTATKKKTAIALLNGDPPSDTHNAIDGASITFDAAP